MSGFFYVKYFLGNVSIIHIWLDKNLSNHIILWYLLGNNNLFVGSAENNLINHFIFSLPKKNYF